MNILNYGCVMVFGLLLSACNNSNKTTSDSEKETITATDIEKKVIPTGEVVKIMVQSDDNMRFDISEIKVKEGQTVKLTLKHNGTMPKSAMGHNFVLLKKGVDVADFGNAAAQAKAPEYAIPAQLLDDIIAHTKMIGGGESDAIEFIAPQKGTYNFLCSFPGHYGMMQGVFIVE